MTRSGLNIRNKSKSNLRGEIWKEIYGYEDTYMISSLGRVKNIISNRILMAGVVRGYFRHILSNNGISKGFYTHRLIAIAFIPNPENKPHINHKNGTKMDNRISNLEWCTASENHIHAFKIKLRKPTYSLLGKTGGLSVFSKRVIKMDLNGEFIQEFPSATLAAASVGRKRPESIAYCARKKGRTSAGFKWEFK